MIADHAQLADQVVEVLQDDAMHAEEIARQLAMRGIVTPRADLDQTLRTLTAQGRLGMRTILDRPCWRVVTVAA